MKDPQEGRQCECDGQAERLQRPFSMHATRQKKVEPDQARIVGL